jgi:hypothetical protein
MSQDIEDTANLRMVRGIFLWPARSLAGGLVVAVGVEDQLAQEFAGAGVDDADVQVLDQEQDAGSGVGPPDADVVEPAVVAEGDDPGKQRTLAAGNRGADGTGQKVDPRGRAEAAITRLVRGNPPGKVSLAGSYALGYAALGMAQMEGDQPPWYPELDTLFLGTVWPGELGTGMSSPTP